MSNERRGLLLLEPGNKILEEAVGAIINWQPTTDKKGRDIPREPMEISSLYDFDDVNYHVLIKEENTDELILSMFLPCYDEIKDQGASAIWDEKYGGHEAINCWDDAESGFTLTMTIDLAKCLEMSQDDRDALIQLVKVWKVNIVGGVFYHHFNALEEGKDVDPYFFHLRADTKVYIVNGSNNCAVVFALTFGDKVDNAIARLFMTEFKDARRAPGMGRAPPCMFGPDPPLEIKDVEGVDRDNCLGYLSFGIQKSHLTSQKDRIVGTLQSFRNYLQYHIKCSKSYFHSCMRRQVTDLLKVLNRAREDPLEGEVKEAKTISGRTFTRGKGAGK